MFVDLLEKRSRKIADLYPMVHNWQPFFKEFSNNIPDSSTLLDFGCGDGTYLIKLLSNKTTCYGVGVDIDDKSIKKAIKNASKQNLKHQLDFIKADLHHIPFKKDVFEGIFAKDIFHHLQNFLPILELSKITKQDGELLIIDQPMTHPLKFFIRKIIQFINISSYTFDESFQFFSPNMLEHMLHDNNFKIYKKQYAEYIFYFLYLFVLFPNYFFNLFLSMLSKNITVMSRMEKTLEKLPGINKLSAYVYFLAKKK